MNRPHESPECCCVACTQWDGIRPPENVLASELVAREAQINLFYDAGIITNAERLELMLK